MGVSHGLKSSTPGLPCCRGALTVLPLYAAELSSGGVMSRRCA